MLNSLIGIIASSGGVSVSSSYESIATVTVGSGGAASIAFSSIPSTYQHLQIRASVGNTVDAYSIAVQFNSDTSTNYSYHYLIGDGSTALAGAGTSTNVMIATPQGTNTGGIQYFNGAVIDVLDYSNVNKNKTLRALGGYDRNGAGRIDLVSGNWRSTSAVTSVQLTPTAANFAQYSSFALYGIKG